MKTKLIIVIAALIAQFTAAQASFASLMDVNGNSNHFVKVTTQNGMVKFEECFKNSNPQCTRTLGPREWYSVKELSSQRSVETMQAYGSIGADAVLVVGAAAGGVFAGAAAASASSGGIFGGMFEALGGAIGGGALGAAAGGTAVALINAINPVEQFQQANTISEAVVSDRPVQTSSIEKFIARLEVVLEKL